MATVEMRNVSKVFPDGTKAVDNFSLDVDDGEFVVLVGPSGCGKSTILRMLAGLEEVTEGEIRIADDVVNEIPPQKRNTAMVFQNYALYPHKTVRQNLAFPLRMMRVSRDERKKRISDVAQILGLTPWLDRRPKSLSGGQRQRVAMGRAMVRNPVVFLLDEPLSNLDAKLRAEVRAEIAHLQQRMETTTVYVTHDQVEAMTLGDRVAVLLDGRLQQLGSGQELYERPQNVFVAQFIGSPGMNVFHSRIVRSDNDNDGFVLQFGQQELAVSTDAISRYGRIEELLDRPLLAGIRPEAFSRGREAGPASCVTVRVAATESLGHEEIVYFQSPARIYNQSGESGNGTMAARLSTCESPFDADEDVPLEIDMEQVVLFGRDGQRLALQ